MEREVITDIWFRSQLALQDIALQIGLRNVVVDSENYWEWVIGECIETKLDITRTHTRPRIEVDTRIFLLDSGTFDEPLLEEVISRIRRVVRGTISAGRWIYRSGNDFDLAIVRQYRGR